MGVSGSQVLCFDVCAFRVLVFRVLGFAFLGFGLYGLGPESACSFQVSTWGPGQVCGHPVAP